MSFIPNEIEKQLFVTTAVLANGATYDSTVLAYDGYTQVQTEIVSSHDGSLQIDFASDSGGTDIIRTLTIPYTAANGYQLFGSVCFGSYVRYQFTNNSGSLQTDFYLTTKKTTTSLSPQMLLADGFISSSMLATLNRSIITGEDQAGDYNNISIITQDNKTSLYTVAGFTNTQTVHLDVEVTTSPKSFMLIDLSDTTNWKHTNTGEIVIEYMVLEVDPGSTFAGEVRIGYLKNVDATNGDFVTLFDVDMKKSAELLVENINFGSHGLHCGDTQHFGPVDANDVAYQTDVNLGGPDDPTTLTYPSGNGDLILQVTDAGAGNAGVDISITIGYETIT